MADLRSALADLDAALAMPDSDLEPARYRVEKACAAVVRTARLAAEELDDLRAELLARRGEDVGDWLRDLDDYEHRGGDPERLRPAVCQHIDGVAWTPVVLDGADENAFRWRGEPMGFRRACELAIAVATGLGWVDARGA